LAQVLAAIYSALHIHLQKPKPLPPFRVIRPLSEADDRVLNRSAEPIEFLSIPWEEVEPRDDLPDQGRLAVWWGSHLDSSGRDGFINITAGRLPEREADELFDAGIDRGRPSSDGEFDAR
jgi:hypothetical protein